MRRRTYDDDGSNLVRPPTLLEAALESNRITLGALFVVVPLVSWAWIVVLAHDMYGPMTGASRWMMTPAWDARHLLLLWAMWAVMMVAMMLPSAAPMILLHGAAARRREGDAAPLLIYALAAGYLTVWSVFSVAATVLQRGLSAMLWLSPMMESTRPAAAVTLLVAGLYQLTPLKQACLRVCQSPLGFLMNRWRPGASGAFRMGADHGVYCVGCCWALMLLLFAGGVMNLLVIAALTVFVAFEKLGLLGRHGSTVSGVALIGLAVWTFLR